jgi:hypothetical protein
MNGIFNDSERGKFLRFLAAGAAAVAARPLIRAVAAGELEAGAEGGGDGFFSVESSSVRTSFSDIPIEEVDPPFLGVEVVGCRSYGESGDVCLDAPIRTSIARQLTLTDLPLNITIPVTARDLKDGTFSVTLMGKTHKTSVDNCVVVGVNSSEKCQGRNFTDNRNVRVAKKGDQWFVRETRQ